MVKLIAGVYEESFVYCDQHDNKLELLLFPESESGHGGTLHMEPVKVMLVSLQEKFCGVSNRWYTEAFLSNVPTSVS